MISVLLVAGKAVLGRRDRPKNRANVAVFIFIWFCMAVIPKNKRPCISSWRARDKVFVGRERRALAGGLFLW